MKHPFSSSRELNCQKRRKQIPKLSFYLITMYPDTCPHHVLWILSSLTSERWLNSLQKTTESDAGEADVDEAILHHCVSTLSDNWNGVDRKEWLNVVECGSCCVVELMRRRRLRKGGAIFISCEAVGSSTKISIGIAAVVPHYEMKISHPSFKW
jgi:hypothetical protein